MDLEPEVRRLSIVDKNARVLPLRLNWAQHEYMQEVRHQYQTRGRVRLIVLKARQLGISTITEACLYCLCFVIPHFRALVLAHERDAAQGLLGMTHTYWDNDPYRALYTTRYVSRNELSWVETKSSMKVATAGSREVGRSKTPFGLHLSEAAFYADPRKSMLGLMNAFPESQGTFAAIESTANGVGDYFQQYWDLASSGEVDYVPLFFPWHRHYEYTASHIGIPAALPGALSDEERALKAIGVSDDRLAWRRWWIKNKCNNDILQFMQEMPSNPEEAFIASGANVFPAKDLLRAYDPRPGVRGDLIETAAGIQFKPRPNGPLTIFSKPSTDRDWGQYFIGGDPARTRNTNSDFACIQVINRRTLEQVAEWRGRIDPVGFADPLFLVGKYYNNAWASPERTGPGHATVGALLAKNYPNIYRHEAPAKIPGHISDDHGWVTTMSTKPLGMSWFINAVVQSQGFDEFGNWLGGFRIHSSQLYQEMKNYVRLDNGEYGPADDQGHDDTVMAMMIAIVCNQIQGRMEMYGAMDAFDPSASSDNLPDRLTEGTMGLPMQEREHNEDDLFDGFVG